MAQTRPSPTLSRGFTRLGPFLAPYAISTQAPGVMSRTSATRRGERTAGSQDLVRGCDKAMRSLDAQATQPVGDTAPRSLQMPTHRGVKTGRRLRPEISDGFTELWGAAG